MGTSPTRGAGNSPRKNSAEENRRRVRDHKHAAGDAADLTKGAAAAERASAGMGTEDTEPADWLFGDTLGQDRSG